MNETSPKPGVRGGTPAAGGVVELRRAGVTLRVEPWGVGAIRVRESPLPGFEERAWALLPTGGSAARVEAADAASVDGGIGSAASDAGGGRVLRNGPISCEVSDAGALRFLDASGGLLLREQDRPHARARGFRGNGQGSFATEQHFEAQAGERFYGLGQRQDGLLDQRGCTLELAQRNATVSVPVALSSRGYGLFWNEPSPGRAELGRNAYRFSAEASRQIDYVVFAPDDAADPWAGLLARWGRLVGTAPSFPAWASGFWQCRLRYRTQDEVLSVARRLHAEGVPASVMVIDFFHWPHMGDFRFDPEHWPDPAAMCAELKELGAEVMVSVWPTATARSENFDELHAGGHLVGSRLGPDPGPQARFIDTSTREDTVYLHYLDPTSSDARAWLWGRCQENYHRHGVRHFWLDSCEPEPLFTPHDPWENMRLHAGPGPEVAQLYPLEHARGFHEGQTAAGQGDVLNLCRSTWAGGQRYGAAVWSGDVQSSWAALAAQVQAGLSMGMSGVPWWTSDIGGFVGGHVEDPGFRELLVRWFEFGVFCPICRLHGHRDPRPEPNFDKLGSGNEPWSFGPAVEAHVHRLLRVREALRPYIHEQMAEATAAGLPVMRPAFVDFPHDPGCAEAEDQYLFGPDLLVAPVAAPGVASRPVRLPAGVGWVGAGGVSHRGGSRVEADAPLGRPALFVRAGSPVRAAVAPLLER